MLYCILQASMESTIGIGKHTRLVIPSVKGQMKPSFEPNNKTDLNADLANRRNFTDSLTNVKLFD